MRQISKTLLATSDPADIVESHRAIPYDDTETDTPNNFTHEFSLDIKNVSYVMYGVWKVETEIPVDIFIGLGKTCWGARMMADIEVDETNPNLATLSVSEDKFAAGKIIGFDIMPSVDLKISHIHYHLFKSHTWDKQWEFSKRPYRFSVVSILGLIIGKLITLGDMIPLGDLLVALFPQNIETGGYYDKNEGIAANGGKLKITPEVVGDVDLVNFLMTVGEDIIRAVFLPEPPAELAVMAVFALGDIYVTVQDFFVPQVALGPSFGLSSPVEISITDFSVGDSKFSVTDTSSSTFTGTGTGNAALPADLSGQNVSVSFHADSHYYLLAGAFIQLSWLKILSAEARKVWQVLDEAESTRDSTFYNIVGATDLTNSSVDKGNLESVV
jgi:hypothetical protein